MHWYDWLILYGVCAPVAMLALLAAIVEWNNRNYTRKH